MVMDVVNVSSQDDAHEEQLTLEADDLLILGIASAFCNHRSNKEYQYLGRTPELQPNKKIIIDRQRYSQSSYATSHAPLRTFPSCHAPHVPCLAPSWAASVGTFQAFQAAGGDWWPRGGAQEPRTWRQPHGLDEGESPGALAPPRGSHRAGAAGVAGGRGGNDVRAQGQDAAESDGIGAD